MCVLNLKTTLIMNVFTLEAFDKSFAVIDFYY